MSTIYPDADLRNADWTKQTWDLPPYGSAAFERHLLQSGMTLEHFQTLPCYLWAVRKGLIVDGKWTGKEMGRRSMNGKRMASKVRDALTADGCEGSGYFNHPGTVY